MSATVPSHRPLLRSKDLLGIADLSKDEIEAILRQSAVFRQVSERFIKKIPTLRGRTVVNLFFEPSTRTRTSFELAAKRLSADIVNISAKASAVTKGESLRDTAQTLAAMNPDTIIIRHPYSGAPHLLARLMDCSVVNAGDGSHEHPTQALLDLFTLQEKFGRVEGLHVAIVGDICHSRVARSNILALNKMGARVTLVGPPTLMPTGIEELGASTSYYLDEVLPDVDVIYLLRLQVERQSQNLLPSIREYTKLYGLSRERLDKAKKGAVVMHPGPMNRGIEIASEVADDPESLVRAQVANGIAVRMAVLYLLSGGEGAV